MQIIEKERKEPRVRQDRKDRLEQRLEARPELRRLEHLDVRVDRDVEQLQDVLQLGRALVQQRHVLDLRAQARLEERDERVEVRVEDDELAEDGREAREERRERRGLRLGELRLAPQPMRYTPPCISTSNLREDERAGLQRHFACCARTSELFPAPACPCKTTACVFARDADGPSATLRRLSLSAPGESRAPASAPALPATLRTGPRRGLASLIALSVMTPEFELLDDIDSERSSAPAPALLPPDELTMNPLPLPTAPPPCRALMCRE